MKSVLRTLLVVFVILLNSGCFLQTLSRVSSESGELEGLITSFNSDSILATCVQGSPMEGNVECTYFFRDEHGVPFDFTSSADLISELGLLGVIIDPVVLQLPPTTTILSATYDSGSGAQPLVVTGPLTGVDVQPGVQLVPESGQGLYVLELPDSVTATIPAGSAMTGSPFSFELSLLSPGPVNELKALFAGKVEVAGHTFYPPLLPCTNDFASVPSIPLSGMSPLDVLPAILGLASGSLGCSGTVYDFTSLGAPAPENIPTMTSWGILALMGLLLLVGVIRILGS